MTSKTFDEEMKETVLIEKHVLFAIKHTCFDSYQNLSLELHNLLGKALTAFESSEKKIFGISIKDKYTLISEFYKDYGHGGNNVATWKNLQCKRLAAKKSYIIAHHALEGKDYHSLHPKNFTDDWDKKINEFKNRIADITGRQIDFYDSGGSNYFLNPM